MIQEKLLQKRLADFLNSLSFTDISLLRKFIMTKKWQEWLNARAYNQRIEL